MRIFLGSIIASLFSLVIFFYFYIKNLFTLKYLNIEICLYFLVIIIFIFIITIFLDFYYSTILTLSFIFLLLNITLYFLFFIYLRAYQYEDVIMDNFIINIEGRFDYEDFWNVITKRVNENKYNIGNRTVETLAHKMYDENKKMADVADELKIVLERIEQKEITAGIVLTVSSIIILYMTLVIYRI